MADPNPSTTDPNAPVQIALTRSTMVSFLAGGLIIAFFLPWMKWLFGTLSGFEFQKFGGKALLLWLMPIFAGLTILAGVTGKSQKAAAQLAGATPFFILAWAFNQMGQQLVSTLEPGAWLGLVLGVILFLAARR